MNTTEWIWCNSSPKPDEYGELLIISLTMPEMFFFAFPATVIMPPISMEIWLPGDSIQIFPMIKFMMKSTLHLFANPAKTVLPSLCGIIVLIQRRYIIPETPGFFMKSSIKKTFYAEVTPKHCPE